MLKKQKSPHDRYFKYVLTIPQVCQEFFAKHLPTEVLTAIDLSSLTPQQESFVDDKLKLQIADLLYAANFNGEPGYLYLLIEHASTPDKMLPYRMLKYTMSIMEQHLKKTSDSKLPFVYPLILYTGERPFTYSTDLFDLFGQVKELARGSMFSPYQLVDLSRMSDEEIRCYEWFKVAAFVSKHIKDPDVLPAFMNILRWLQELEKTGEYEYIYVTLSYIMEAGEVKDQNTFFQAIKEGFTHIDEEKVMTLAEQWRQEGFRKGKEQGMQQGIQQGIQQGMQQGMNEASHVIAIKLIKFGLDEKSVAEATNLSFREVQMIKNSLLT